MGKSASPQSSSDWAQVEYALNMHGHSIRGLEKVPGMPLAQKRDQKREPAIFGVMEAMNVYKGDYSQIAMIAKRLSSFSVSVALEDASLDEVAMVCFPTDEEVQRAAEVAAESTITEEIKTSGDNRPAKKTRRVSKGSIKGFDQRIEDAFVGEI